MVLIVKAERVTNVLDQLHEAEEPAWVLGRLIKGTGVVSYR
jgi:phosphoribosylaminoimidazole (AIR) synthetase